MPRSDHDDLKGLRFPVPRTQMNKRVDHQERLREKLRAWKEGSTEFTEGAVMVHTATDTANTTYMDGCLPDAVARMLGLIGVGETL